MSIYFSAIDYEKTLLMGANRKLWFSFIFICIITPNSDEKNRSSTVPTRFLCILTPMLIVVFFVPASPQADVQFVQRPLPPQLITATPHRLIVMSKLFSHCTPPPSLGVLATHLRRRIEFWWECTSIFDHVHVNVCLQFIDIEKILVSNVNK